MAGSVSGRWAFAALSQWSMREPHSAPDGGTAGVAVTVCNGGPSRTPGAASLRPERRSAIDVRGAVRTAGLSFVYRIGLPLALLPC